MLCPGLAGLGWLVHLFGPPWAPSGSFCRYLSWVRSWGLFYMRIYRRILSLGFFLHAHLPPYPFPWGLFTCAFTAVSFPVGPFCIRISAVSFPFYMRITAVSFPLGRLCMRISAVSFPFYMRISAVSFPLGLFYMRISVVSFPFYMRISTVSFPLRPLT